LSAAFGGSLDWKTSEGEDRYRRALYIEWRRTSPYPSMAAFDAPNREVCALRRPRSNTPLQALVTLNDPVYVEASQALARRIAETQGSTLDKVRYGFRLCLARPPGEKESRALLNLYEAARADYAKQPDVAEQFATGQSSATNSPSRAESGDENQKSKNAPRSTLHAPPSSVAGPDLAAWTAVANVLLNLDETLMRP
jgi:hypothetical protein